MSMFRTFITKILGGYDAAILDATVRYRLREEYLARFGELVYADLTSVMQELVATDRRITYEERNRGFYIKFNDVVLFRASVNIFTTRATMLCDRIEILSYDGLSEDVLNSYSAGCKASEAMRTAILATFSNTMREHLIEQLERI
jgi:hypothetical protein